ncbi:MAG: DNA alkylation repair protein [Gaiellales bacterium]|nr:DNA alkylation repair protein [Gaiellales bacterium]
MRRPGRKVVNVDAAQVLAELCQQADPKTAEGMTRVGISPRGTLGVQIPSLQKMARGLGTDHGLAADLWASGVHEARILAAMVEDPAAVSSEQMDLWAAAFDSWDVCDQVCKYAFARTSLAYQKAAEWTGHSGQYVKRAAFSLMADLAVNDKKADDERFLSFLALCEREASDDRNYVKKAVNWALRQIGKRNVALNQAALAAASRIKAQGSRGSSWIAADALRELSAVSAKRGWDTAAGEAGTADQVVSVTPEGGMTASVGKPKRAPRARGTAKAKGKAEGKEGGAEAPSGHEAAE